MLRSKFLSDVFTKIFLAAIPVLIIMLPADFFDHGQSICLSLLFLKAECLGCGMTRAVMHLLHGDINESWQLNKSSFIVLPILLLFYTKGIATYFFNKKIICWLR